MLAKIASVAAAPVRVVERDDVLGVGRRLQAGDRAVLVAGPRHGDHARSRRDHGAAPAAATITVGPPSPRSEPSGPTPPVTVRRRRPRRPAVGRDHRLAWRPAAVVVERDRQAAARRRAAQPVEVAPSRERLAPHDLQRLEHAVADGEPVVERRDVASTRGRRSAPSIHDRARVDRHAAHGVDAGEADRRSSRRAFSSVSAHSPAGVESQVMPPPVPKCSWPSSIQNVRMATLSSPCRRSASTQPTAPQ